MESFLQTMLLTFKVSIITTAILLCIALPLGYFLAFYKSKITPILETIVSMPLVLPPSVLGFYLLIAFSPQNFLGAFLLEYFDIKFVFSFEGVILASIIFSMPFMINPIQAGFASLPKSLYEAALTLGKSRIEIFFKVLIPNIKNSIIVGIVVTFAHTIGEFGVIMMIGGNIEGVTRVASIAIYDEVESLNYALAHKYALTLFLVTFSILLLTFYLNKKDKL
ncbi:MULTISPECIES: molybdate ABC transporter permease subunit [Helicobacter]|uniref:Molybdenum transport system permease n=1 Tax=Helicobacter ibis TaxID=2962633 RepID=A0ABT4VEQ1_9HELI|nr:MULTISPECIES: molybdate ABC transporter permease subunit [Helicobacter]MDA3967053.1 molybdate ABC transporter permease subunit [Helicobacter sp. WB40]MDA3969187.1 molybdate ABC transporter permease subunit [Helicobacter ibis]